MNKTLAFLTNLLFPARCLFCRALLPKDQVCNRCKDSLPKVKTGVLFPLEGSICAAPFFYEGAVRTLVHRFKFHGKHALCSPMSEYLANAAQTLPAADLVAWVPVSGRRLRTRGYDQSFLLAKETAAKLWLPTVAALQKVRDVPTQNRLTDRQSRRQNVTGAYEAKSSLVEGRRILLVDDVFTSGATLEECVLALRQAGAASVVCAVFAKTRRTLPEKMKNVL